MRKIIIPVVTSALFVVATPGWAGAETPEQVVERYHVEFGTRRWLALSDYLHPEDLSRFKKTFLSLFSESNAKTRQSLEEMYGPGVTLKSLAEGPDSVFLEPILVMLNQRLDSAKLRVTSQQVLGTVPDGEFCHVVYRWKSETSQLQQSQVEVRTLRKYQDTWRFTLPVNLENAIPAIRRSLQQ